MVLETALAFALVVGAGLLIRSYLRLENVDPGFEPGRVVTMNLSLPPTRYTEPGRAAAFYRRLLERVQDVPGVDSAAVVNYLPLGGGHSCDAFTIDAAPPSRPGAAPCAEYRRIGAEYFRTMGIPLLRGRVFSESDHESAPLVAIVNETMARRFWRNEDVVGERVTAHGVSREIVGVVGDVKQFGLDRDAPAGLYVPHVQDPVGEYALVVRARLDLSELTTRVRKEVAALETDLPVYNVRTMEHLLSRSTAEPRFRTSLLGLFAAAALVLATVGVYGVVFQSTSARTREVGVRMALGAGRTEILGMILWEGLRLGVLGLFLGVALALGLGRFLSGLLFGIDAADPITFGTVGIVILASTLLACYVPARKASRVDPMVALRYE